MTSQGPDHICSPSQGLTRPPYINQAQQCIATTYVAISVNRFPDLFRKGREVWEHWYTKVVLEECN